MLHRHVHAAPEGVPPVTHYLYSVVATSPCSVLLLQSQDFQAYLDDHPKVKAHIAEQGETTLLAHFSGRDASL